MLNLDGVTFETTALICQKNGYIIEIFCHINFQRVLKNFEGIVMTLRHDHIFPLKTQIVITRTYRAHAYTNENRFFRQSESKSV